MISSRKERAAFQPSCSGRKNNVSSPPMNEVSEQELKKVIGDFLDMGHVENIIAMFRHEPAYYAMAGALLRDERLMVRMGMTILFEELAGSRPEEVALAIPSLIPLLGDSASYIRGDAANILAIIGTAEALKPLAALVNDPDPQVAAMVREILHIKP